MISYDLAKELKEAGWPQPESGNDLNFVYSGGICGRSDARALDAVYAPSLSELIAAIPTVIDGKKALLTLYRDEDGCSAAIETEEAVPVGEMQGKEVRQIADSEGEEMDEAVARLWLKLKEGKV